MKYALDTDFSSLNGPKAANWVLKFSDIVDTAFADSSTHAKLLGNLLVLEPYIHTLRQGLAGRGRAIPVIMQKALDLLWGYLEGVNLPSEFEDFANNFFASTLNYNTGEEITDTQMNFYREYFDDVEQTTIEWQILTWQSTLRMELLAATGGRLDFEEYEESENTIGFDGMDEMLNLLGDVCIELTGTPCASNKAVDVMKAQEQVYQTPLFQEFVSHIQNALKEALSALPGQYKVLQVEYRQHTILPSEYAGIILDY